MARPIHLYVSSSPDLAQEREVLGQAVAELPVSVGWELRHTPEPHDDAAAALDFIGSCDLYLIVLGSDFAAPMGVEWRLAQGAGKPVLAYRKRALHSPSAESFLRQADAQWTVFERPGDLKAHLAPALAQAVLDRAECVGLHLDEVEALLSRVKAEATSTAETDQRRGAERGGIILGRGT